MTEETARETPQPLHLLGAGSVGVRAPAGHSDSRPAPARWTVSEHDLDQLTGLPRPFVLHRFDTGARPLGDLLDLVALRDHPAATTLNGRFLWPYRLVTGDDPETAVGMLLPTVPERFTTADGHGGRAPRPLNAPRPDQPTNLRAQLCAALADTIHLAHQHGIVLGTDALASALHTGTPAPEVLIADCTRVRPRRPGGLDRQAGDLTWLGRFVHHCAPPPGDTPLLDGAGRELLRRARSDVAHLLPTAAEWRNYLTARAATLQGPPVIEQVQVSPEIVPPGSPVTVRWRTRHADRLVITGPDGTTVTAAPNERDEGHTALIITRPGPVRLRAANPAGSHQAETGHVHVFELPQLPRIQLPRLPLEPAATRRHRTTLPALPPVAVPAPPSGALRVTGFPIDVARWFDTRPERPRRRWPRWLRKPWA
ncbi:hypothetical protein QLQ12_13990 [Actinoplanes sp. NEAU-A12]|uniref:Protein kinase domain-containing protein n=1 Tax=Actinoplanes sandaracinus TaxID=3045177 RepID=A0ABT6WJ64_9ACTN|nr:hypothetical protein [Actinoplanes sandaracinus]MDI6099710.1 hypothetical protein [Actinoplanes sandaracinus]